MLFQLEGSAAKADEVVARVWKNFEAEPEGKAYADALVRDCAARMDDVDARIKAAATNWRIERMTRLDRNLLRLSTLELIARLDVPRAVILDEAVELAKSFGTEESSAFVNGVLTRIADDLGRKDSDRS
ncbi:transcription antitermination factor NusB [soil metagenome]